MNGTEDKIWYLKQFNLFDKLPKNYLMELSKVCLMKAYKPHEMIVLPGLNQKLIFFLKEGKVKIGRYSNKGEEMILDILVPGEIFGKLSYASEHAENEWATAIEESLVCYLTLEEWRDFCEQKPDLNLKVLKFMWFRIRKLERHIESLFFKDIKSRLIEFLSDFANRYGKKDGSSIRIATNLTHEDIGKLIGSSRQGVATFMNDLRNEEILDYSRKEIILLQPDRFN